MSERCGNCRFFDAGLREGDGDCRRYPPVIVPTPQSEVEHWTTAWPEVSTHEWCGEYIAANPEPR